MDGSAVHAADVAAATTAAPVYLAVTDQIPAGDIPAQATVPGHVRPDHDRALVPPGADAVVPVEWTDGGRERNRHQPARPARPRHPAARR